MKETIKVQEEMMTMTNHHVPTEDRLRGASKFVKNLLATLQKEIETLSTDDQSTKDSAFDQDFPEEIKQEDQYDQEADFEDEELEHFGLVTMHKQEPTDVTDSNLHKGVNYKNAVKAVMEGLLENGVFTPVSSV